MGKSRVHDKQESLKHVYALFESVMDSFDTACKKKCAACCTCNVTMTGLEAHLILDRLDSSQKKQVKERLIHHCPETRYHPQLTTNMFARYVMEGIKVPEEKNDPSWGSCPLLVSDECTIYALRPLGCRALMSQKNCDLQGYASMPPLLLTINTVFQQAVEHLDAGGVFGNLSDLLCAGSNGWKKSKPAIRQKMLKNEAISILMVPEEHREKMAGTIGRLSGIIL